MLHPLSQGEHRPFFLTSEKLHSWHKHWLMSVVLRKQLTVPNHIIHTRLHPDVIIFSDSTLITTSQTTLTWKDHTEEAHERSLVQFWELVEQYRQGLAGSIVIPMLKDLKPHLPKKLCFPTHKMLPWEVSWNLTRYFYFCGLLWTFMLLLITYSMISLSESWMYFQWSLKYERQGTNGQKEVNKAKKKKMFNIGFFFFFADILILFNF